MIKIKYICFVLLLSSICWAGLDLDGVDDWVNCPQMAFLEGATAMSFSIQARVNESTGNGWLYQKIEVSESFQAFYDGNDLRTRLDAGGGDSVLAGPDKAGFVYDDWFTYTCTYDNSNFRVYFNGVETAFGALNGGIDLTGGSSIFRMGSSQTPTAWNGDIKEGTLWNVALTPEEVLQIHKSFLSGITHQIQPNNREAYWPMDEVPQGGNMAGVTFVDRSGNGKDATGSDANTSGGQGIAEDQLSRP